MKPTNHLALLTNAYLRASGAPRSLRYILSLSYTGIAIGALALMLALVITRGFERDIGQRVKSINSDAVIASPGNQLDITSLSARIRQVMGKYIQGISGSSTRYITVQLEKGHQVLFVRGIEPQAEAETTCLPNKIVTPRNHSLFQLLATPGNAIIGSGLATRHHLCCGDQLTVYAPQEEESRSIDLAKHTLTVTGVFSVGLDEYDSNAAYCSLKTMQHLFPKMRGVDQLAITFKPLPPPLKTLSWAQSARAWSYYLFHSAESYY
jgi:ABC-type lipoprotein release transport system permease subunit